MENFIFCAVICNILLIDLVKWDNNLLGKLLERYMKSSVNNTKVLFMIES